ncbi:MAG: cobalamin biosynthesis protein CobQ [Oscillospiraceae bacterium]|nr:cobalamin biosynthesis protein CobQ [Oscillospiraceae bacterium]
MEFGQKRVILLTGDYGCGKTNLAVNLAILLAEKGKVSVVDMDTVNPYFRTADFGETLTKRGINVVFPQYANTNLDIPVLNFDLESVISESDFTIIDIGGSDAGAYPAGRYESLLKSLGEQLEMLYLFNMYRLCERSADEIVKTLREIESACRLKCTGLVNNSNLGAETTRETVAASGEFAEEVAEKTGLPIRFTCVTENEKPDETHLPIKRLVTLPWETEREI